jgi:preprotein translocase subunit YajC
LVGPFLVAVASRAEVVGRHRPPLPFSHHWGTTVGNLASISLALFAADAGSSMMQNILLIWVPIGFLFWFLLIRPQQREKKQRETMLSAVKKNDRVITVGGIYGLVTNVDREKDEITVKVDEAANVKVRVTMGSIARVMIDESSK